MREREDRASATTGAALASVVSALFLLAIKGWATLAIRSSPLSASEPSIAIDDVCSAAQVFIAMSTSAITTLAIAARVVSADRSAPCARSRSWP